MGEAIVCQVGKSQSCLVGEAIVMPGGKATVTEMYPCAPFEKY